MGYNLAAAFLPEPPKPKFFPPFEGPVKGFKPDIKIITSAMNKGKTASMLLELRQFWLDGFVQAVRVMLPTASKQPLIDWLNARPQSLPANAQALRDSIQSGHLVELAEQCAKELSK